jgi:hypothetical protein
VKQEFVVLAVNFWFPVAVALVIWKNPENELLKGGTVKALLAVPEVTAVTTADDGS